eukprot:c14964_g1_i1 orf=211-1140(+)
MDACSRWWNKDTMVVVTGGNKGIGLEVCKQMAEKGLTVVLTARDEKRGQDAVEALLKQGLHNIQFHPLDVQDDKSIASFASWLLREHKGLDILINNAGISGVIIDHEYAKESQIDLMDLLFKQETSKGLIYDYASAKACIDTNYYGAKRVTKALLPILRPSLGGARIINIGSEYGMLHHQSINLQENLANINNLSEKYIDELLDNFLDDVKSKTWENKGWPLKHPSYKMSKVALHAYTRILAKELENRPHNQRAFVNCVHPGFVRTDITSFQGDMTPKEGAENVVRVALLPPQDSPSGQFFYEKNLSSF